MQLRRKGGVLGSRRTPSSCAHGHGDRQYGRQGHGNRGDDAEREQAGDDTIDGGSGDDIAIGADREDIDEVMDDNAGAAYVYTVPEPAALAASLAALATVFLLKALRCGRLVA